jgi:hypothetical protein
MGIMLLNKLTALACGAALGIGLLLSSQRKALKDPFLYLGGLIALLLLLPHILWQAGNGWPFLEFLSNARVYKLIGVSPLEFLSGQLVMAGPHLLVFWIAGLFYLLFAKSMAPYRMLGIVFAALFLIFLLHQGKSYYLSPAYPMVYAAGAVAVEQWGRRPRMKWLPAGAMVFVTIFGLILSPIALPMLPPDTYLAYSAKIGMEPPRDEKGHTALLPQHLADRIGWEAMVETIADAYHKLPAEDQSRCAIFTTNYGRAGAIDFFGPQYGLPNAISGNNSYHLWGPGNATGEVTLVITKQTEEVSRFCESYEELARHHADYAMPFETDLPIYLCRGLKMSMEEFWREVKSYI